MRSNLDPTIIELQSQAGEAATFLKLIANERRLLILCRLASGEATVAELTTIANLSQSAMSQHLAKMRKDGLVQGRKDGLQVFYSIADDRCFGILDQLKTVFCHAADNVAGCTTRPA